MSVMPRPKSNPQILELAKRGAEVQIREALDAARSEIEAVAAEAAQEMVSRLIGQSIDEKRSALASLATTISSVVFRSMSVLAYIAE